jgi:hypothetical protein
MDIFYDKTQIQLHIDNFFLMLRTQDPNLLPWKVGGSIYDTNPQLLNPAHPLRACITHFWSRKAKDVTKPIATNTMRMRFWCHQYNRWEMELMKRAWSRFRSPKSSLLSLLISLQAVDSLSFAEVEGMTS